MPLTPCKTKPCFDNMTRDEQTWEIYKALCEIKEEIDEIKDELDEIKSLVE